MSIRIKTNIIAQTVHKNLRKTSEKRFEQLEKLSSGKRINRAKDDTAGLSVAAKMDAQVRGLKMALKNANDGVSFVQTAEGGLHEISNILVRLRELTIQSASDTIGQNERMSVEKEYQSLMSEIDRISEATTFNGTNVINGHGQGHLSFHVGASAGDENIILFDSDSANTSLEAIGIDGTTINSKNDAKGAISDIDTAINGVNSQRAELGAVQSRLHSTINNIEIQTINHDKARSIIEDVDVADSSSKLISANILSKAGTATLAQANMQPMSAMKLIK